jgi:hypothetical protein
MRTAHAALDQARQHKSDELVARILMHQAEGLFYQGQAAGARKLYQQAASTASTAGAKEPNQIARLQVAKLDLYEGQAARAASALRTLTGLVDAYATAQLTLLSAEADLRTGQQARGVDQLQSAVAKAERLGTRVLALHGHYLLMNALPDAQKAEANRHRDKARQLLDEIRKEARTDDIVKRADLARIASALK